MAAVGALVAVAVHPIEGPLPPKAAIIERPVNVVMAPDAKRAYVGAFDGRSVAILDAHDALTATVGLGADPADLALGPRDLLYVAEPAARRIDIVDVKSKRKLGNGLSVPGAPQAVTVEPDGTVVAALPALGAVVVFPPGASFPAPLIPVPGRPIDVTPAARPGRVLVLTHGAVLEVGTRQGTIVRAVSLPDSASPGSAVAGPGDLVYVADTSSEVVWKVNLADPTTLPQPMRIGGGVGGLAIAGDLLFVAVRTRHEVVVLDAASGRQRGEPIDTVVPPEAIAVTPDGRWILVTDLHGNTVRRSPVVAR